MVFSKNEGRTRFYGFTLIEIIIVVVILGIAALLAIPMMGTAANIQVKSAANMIAADLEYARSMAITTQQRHSVVFNSATESYEVHNSLGAVIAHPVKTGSILSVSFPGNSDLSRVVIESAVFDDDTDGAVTFDYLGSPYKGLTTDAASSLVSGIITLKADTFSMTVEIEPVTGYITIQ